MVDVADLKMNRSLIVPIFIATSLVGCDDRARSITPQAQQFVHFGGAVMESHESLSGEREFVFTLAAENPRAELELRFEFPEPKRLLSISSTQDETILVLKGEDGVYRFDHWELIAQKERYRTDTLNSLDQFKRKIK